MEGNKKMQARSSKQQQAVPPPISVMRNNKTEGDRKRDRDTSQHVLCLRRSSLSPGVAISSLMASYVAFFLLYSSRVILFWQ